MTTCMHIKQTYRARRRIYKNKLYCDCGVYLNIFNLKVCKFHCIHDYGVYNNIRILLYCTLWIFSHEYVYILCLRVMDFDNTRRYLDATKLRKEVVLICVIGYCNIKCSVQSSTSKQAFNYLYIHTYYGSTSNTIIKYSRMDFETNFSVKIK